MLENGHYDYPTRDAGYFQANFAYDPLKLADFTYLGEHPSLPFGKELLRKFMDRRHRGATSTAAPAAGTMR